MKIQGPFSNGAEVELLGRDVGDLPTFEVSDGRVRDILEDLGTGLRPEA